MPQTLLDSFVSHARREPSAPALAWRGQTTSYGDLHELATQAHNRLRDLGLRPGAAVGIHATKSPAAIALVLACLIDKRPFLLPAADLSEQILSTLFDRAHCAAVLSPDGFTIRDGVEMTHGDQDIAFMLTTSGSTGIPKVVPLSSAGISRFTEWAADRFDIRRGVTVLNYAPLNFDLCLLDVWTTLAGGGQVVLIDADQATNAAHLLSLFETHQIHLVQAVPMVYRLLTDATRERGQSLDEVQHVIFTGDSIPQACLAELPRLFPKAALYNVYGCTETNDSFIHEIDTSQQASTPVPLGRPLPGVHAMLVDDTGTTVDGAGTGELWVSTPFQTAGYLDDSLNRDKFALGADGRRYFRSGDLVRRDQDGTLVLNGRNDFQVKVRGVRINPQQVEEALLDHPDVVEAVVLAQPDPLAGSSLHAVVRRSADSDLNSLVLRQHCAARLTRAAIPSSMRIVDEPLPRTSTGKPDRIQITRTYLKEG